MDTSFPPSNNLNLDLYKAEDNNSCCCGKITKFYRKNKPFIYEFKDTEGNNHVLEIVFTHVDHYQHYENDDGAPANLKYSSVHFYEEARLRRLALKAYEIYKETGKVILINPDRALDSLELAEEWWAKLAKKSAVSPESQNIRKTNLNNFLIEFKDENPNFPITVETKKFLGIPKKSVVEKEVEEILKFTRFIGAYEKTTNSNSKSSRSKHKKKRNQRKIDGYDFEANLNSNQNDKRTFVRKDLSGMEHELQIDASDCEYQEYLKTEALAKQSFKIYKQGGPVIIIDPNFALGTKEAAEKWFETKKKQSLIGFLILGIAISIYITTAVFASENYASDAAVVVEILKIALVFILLSLMPVAIFRFFSERRERELIEIDGQKYCGKEFRIYQVMVGGNLDPNDAGSFMQLKLR